MVGIGLALQRFVDEEVARNPAHDFQHFGVRDVAAFEVVLDHPFAGGDEVRVLGGKGERGREGKKNPSHQKK
jgi:hypothetical protein